MLRSSLTLSWNTLHLRAQTSDRWLKTRVTSVLFLPGFHNLSHTTCIEYPPKFSAEMCKLESLEHRSIARGLEASSRTAGQNKIRTLHTEDKHAVSQQALPQKSPSQHCQQVHKSNGNPVLVIRLAPLPLVLPSGLWPLVA